MRLIVLALILASFTSFAQVGDNFPDMETESLTHNIISIPNDIKGKYSLLCLAYSKKAEDDLTHWFSPIYNHFISEPQDLFSFNYDINTFFIPMFTGAKRPAYKKVMKKVQETVDPRIQPHVLFYEGTLVEYRTKLEFDDAKRPYFYVVDPEGKIIHATSGEYTDRKMQEIINALSPSLN